MADKITQAVILSAGLGTRLKAITREKIPKVMVPLGGKPLLQWHIERLTSYGVEEVFINLFYLPKIVQSYFGDGSKWGVKIFYNVEMPNILGTAGGIKAFEDRLNEEFIVCYGDEFNLVNFATMSQVYQSHSDIIALTTVGDTDHLHDSDLAKLDSDMRFIKIYPKPHKRLPPNYKSMKAAAFIFSKRILDYIPNKTYFEIDHQLLPKVISAGENVYGYESQDYIEDIGTPERYRKVQEFLRKNPGLR